MVNDIDEGKLPKTESKLAVECYISPQSTSIQAIVTESQPLFGVANYEITTIKNAKVILSGPSGQVVLPFNDSLSIYILPASQFKIEAGKTYKLTVSDPNRTVTASCTVPAKAVSLKKYTLNIIEGEPEQWDTTAHTTLVKAKFYWDDIAQEKNYYLLRGYSSISENQYRYSPSGIPGEAYRYEYKNPFYIGGMMDNSADGLTLNSEFLEVFLRNYSREYRDQKGNIIYLKNDAKLNEIFVEIMTIDENYHKFQRTSGQDSGDNPFIEPTLVYTNIEGGLGCFGAINSSATTIKP
jgi:hypothetical protein